MRVLVAPEALVLLPRTDTTPKVTVRNPDGVDSMPGLYGREPFESHTS